MNRVLPCTIKFNNYLLIMAKGKSTKKIKDYDDLIKQLKKWDVSPQETWDLVYKMKLGLDTKTVWKLQRFNHFARLRLNSFVEVSKKKEKDHYVSTLNWQDYLLEIKKHLPKRVDTIKELVDSLFYSAFYKFYFKNKTLDIKQKRKEIKNLEKLIIDKRQDKWFQPEWIDAVEDMENAFVQTGSFKKVSKQLKVKSYFDRPGFRDILKILR